MTPRRREQLSIASLERVAADATLAASRNRSQRDRLAAALSVAVEGIVVVDADGIEVFRNAAAARFRHARHSDAVAERTITSMLERALAGETCEHELHLFGPPPAVLDLRALPLSEGGMLLGAAVLVHDVSEIHRVESVRRDFVANVSHELKTPVGGLELLAETLASESKPSVIRPLAERIVEEAERLGRIVDDLLDLSIIEARASTVRDRIGASTLLGEAVARMRPAASARGVELRVRDDAGEAIVACDRRQIVSAIANLLDNAIKYSEADSVVEVGADVDGGCLEFSVRDEGIGIPKRDIERIFERFYRVDQARSRTTGGTGLGLAIVRHVAQAHGGEVTVESVEGEGSTFRLALPIDTAGPPQFAAKES
jgi:two-component system, OmpR family, sensor histidine kinase SenX3